MQTIKMYHHQLFKEVNTLLSIWSIWSIDGIIKGVDQEVIEKKDDSTLHKVLELEPYHQHRLELYLRNKRFMKQPAGE